MQEMQGTWVPSLGREDPLEKGMANLQAVFSPGESHRKRSLVGYSPWGHTELDMTGLTHIHVRHVGELSEPRISLMSFPAADAKRGNVWTQGHTLKKTKGSSGRNSRGAQPTGGCTDTLKGVSLGCFLSFGRSMHPKLLNTALAVGKALSDVAEVLASAWALCLFGRAL